MEHTKTARSPRESSSAQSKAKKTRVSASTVRCQTYTPAYTISLPQIDEIPIIDADSRHRVALFTYGRFQPPHAGHGLIIQ